MCYPTNRLGINVLSHVAFRRFPPYFNSSHSFQNKLFNQLHHTDQNNVFDNFKFHKTIFFNVISFNYRKEANTIVLKIVLKNYLLRVILPLFRITYIVFPVLRSLCYLLFLYIYFGCL